MKRFWEESLCRATSHWTFCATKVIPGVINSTSSGTIAIEEAVRLGTIAAIKFIPHRLLTVTLCRSVAARGFLPLGRPRTLQGIRHGIHTTHLLDVISRCVQSVALITHALEARACPLRCSRCLAYGVLPGIMFLRFGTIALQTGRRRPYRLLYLARPLFSAPGQNILGCRLVVHHVVIAWKCDLGLVDAALDPKLIEAELDELISAIQASSFTCPVFAYLRGSWWWCLTDRHRTVPTVLVVAPRRCFVLAPP